MASIIDDLIARMAEAETERALNTIFREEILDCGYAAYDAFSHVLDSRMAIRAPENFIIASYDMNILGPYLQKGMAEICPGLTEMCASITPFEYIAFLRRTRENSSVIWQRRILAGFRIKRAWCVPLSNLGVMQGVTVYQRGDTDEDKRIFVDTRDHLALAASYYMEALLAFRSNAKGAAIKKTNDPALLSPRELDCLGWISNGQTSREIAAALSISENTVNFHLKNIYRKLHVTSRIQAVAAAHRMGIFEEAAQVPLPQ